MKKVYEAKNYVDAHMIVDALEKQGIEAFVKEDRAVPNEASVWIQEEDKFSKAIKVIAEMDKANDEIHETVMPVGNRSSRFGIGFFLGAIASLLVLVFIFKPDFSSKRNETKWDRNGDGIIDQWRETKPEGVVVDIFDANYDGKPDTWIYYLNGKQQKVIADTNFDGSPDEWTFYDGKGLIERSEHDIDFDGKVDCWRYYKDGMPVKEACDDDFDGKPDNWATFEKARLVERTWSFNNDGIIDKKALYKRGRRVEEWYDTNRDGKFDQRVLLDQFERVIKRENF